jgi:DNA-binding MarR family transcriptional regulator
VVEFIANAILHNHVVAQRVGLGASDAQFMTLLNVHGPLTPGDLARLTGMTTGTVTGVLDRLENAGLVERTRDAADRRRVVVTTNDEGIARILAPHYREQAVALAEVAAQRSPEELGVVERFLRDLLERQIERQAAELWTTARARRPRRPTEAPGTSAAPPDPPR